MSDPACRTFRELLGVYVVGAIEPHERSVLDAHLNQCYGCREELAGLAVLPALLHRIPIAEAEQLALAGQPGDEPDDPAPQVLSGLLAEVAARRRSRRLRTVLAAAAALIVAVGGSAGIVTALDQPAAQQQNVAGLDTVSVHRGHMSMTVKYGQSPWGTEMWVQVSGVPQGTHCEFWVHTRGGQSLLVGGWQIKPGVAHLWYQTEAQVPSATVTGFVLTSAGKLLMHVPAT